MPENKKNKKPSLRRILSNAMYMLKFAIKFTPSYVFWMVVEGVVWGLIHSFTSVIFVKMLFDKLEIGDFRETAWIIALMALFSLITYLFHVWYWNIYNPVIRKKLHLKMQEVLFEKARNMDLECYDNPNFYNDFVWAIRESDSRVVGVIENIGKLINRLIATVTIVGVLLTIDIVVVCAIIILSACAPLFRLWRQKVNFSRQQEEVMVKRKKDYISRVFNLPDYAKEMRTSQVSDLLIDEYDDNLLKRKDIIDRYGRKNVLINGLESAIQQLFGQCGITVLLTIRLFIGAIALGDFAAGVNSIWKLYWQINSLTEFITQYSEHSLYAEQFRKFLEYESKIKGGSTPVSSLREIEFHDVSFAYSDSKTNALSNVNFRIRRGEKIAIVGYNGAGKSTLIKLIMQLYVPTNGKISWNGIDARELNLEGYRDHIVALFQDYQIFAGTVAENVLADTYVDSFEQYIINSLADASFNERLETMQDGIHTHLSKEFYEDGVNLSGGESQKVAIARAFAKAKIKMCDLIIMDEPSSALDPIAEYELNQMILKGTKDKTVVFISHRLSTTRMADRIYMFDEGRLVEFGSHDELMKLNGKYSEMFNLQSEKYAY